MRPMISISSRRAFEALRLRDQGAPDVKREGPMPRPGPGESERRLGDLIADLDKIARPDVPGHEIRTLYGSIQDITAHVLATSGVRDAEEAGSSTTCIGSLATPRRNGRSGANCWTGCCPWPSPPRGPRRSPR